MQAIGGAPGSKLGVGIQSVSWRKPGALCLTQLVLTGPACERRGIAADGGGSVVHLLKPIVSLVVAPFDEHRSMVDAWAVQSPALKPDMGVWENCGRRARPGKIALCAITAKIDMCKTFAIALSTGFVLACQTHIKNPNRPHEIEFRSTDVDIRAITNVTQCKIRCGKIVSDLVGAPNGIRRCSAESVAGHWKRLVRLDVDTFEQDVKEPLCLIGLAVQLI